MVATYVWCWKQARPSKTGKTQQLPMHAVDQSASAGPPRRTTTKQLAELIISFELIEIRNYLLKYEQNCYSAFKVDRFIISFCIKQIYLIFSQEN
jgi:hypothetical protein